MNRSIYRKPGESGAEPYLSSQFMGLFGWRAFIAGGDPISMGHPPSAPVEKSCQGKHHDRQDELPWIVHRAGHAVLERRDQRGERSTEARLGGHGVFLGTTSPQGHWAEPHRYRVAASDESPPAK